MRDAFADQLDSIFDDLAAICRSVGTAVTGATTALLQGSVDDAEAVISGDAQIDQARETLEDKAFSLLSLQQPVAGDLRTVVAALRMVAELERMGDLAVHIAKIARMRVPEIAVPADVVPTIQRMAQVAEAMVAQTAVVIAHRDIEAAGDLAGSEEEMDELRSESFRKLLGKDWPHGIEAAVDLALLGRYFERIGDHAVSVVNRVVYVVTGERAHVEG